MKIIGEFFDVSVVGAGIPSMPRNAATPAKIAGHHMPAQKLLPISQLSCDDRTATARSDGHGLTVNSAGTIYLGHADQSVFNGRFTYQVTDADHITFSVNETFTGNATGNFSACLDIFEGDYYSITQNSQVGYSTTNNFIGRYSKSGAEIWKTPISIQSDLNWVYFSGISMDEFGDIIFSVFNPKVNSKPETLEVYRLRKDTGNFSLIHKYLAVVANGHFPGTPGSDPIRTRYVDNVPWWTPTAASKMDQTPPITRLVFDALPGGKYLFCGRSYHSNDQTVKVLMNSAGGFDEGELLKKGDGVTPTDIPVQYITKDGKVKLGQIFMYFDLQSGDFIGRRASISRGQGTGKFDLPNDLNGWFTVDRRSTPNLNLWTDNWVIEGQAESYYKYSNFNTKRWPEPIKVHAMGDYVFITAAQMPVYQASIRHAHILGSNFMRRKEFDAWLHSVCDLIGLGE